MGQDRTGYDRIRFKSRFNWIRVEQIRLDKLERIDRIDLIYLIRWVGRQVDGWMNRWIDRNHKNSNNNNPNKKAKKVEL